ncbi:MAG: thioredoxin-disulfide reductase [Syntrophaceae bacterium]
METYDIIIIGGGPAGLTAGIYASRAKMKTLLIESTFSASLITTTDMVENYPGFPGGIDGFGLVERFKEQALSFGLETLQDDITEIQAAASDVSSGWFAIGGQEYHARSLIVASGAAYAKLGVPGEKEFTGRGVSYCATCDAPFYRDRTIVVVGGGDTAVQEALFLTKFASRVTLVHRRDSLRATAILQERAFANEKLDFVWSSVVEEIRGEKAVSAVRLKNLVSGRSEDLAADGVFIFAGYIPNTELAGGIVTRDQDGYIVVDDHMRTSQPGIFACGDCIRKLLRQVVTACGDGATAAFAAQLYVEELKGTLYPHRK